MPPSGGAAAPITTAQAQVTTATVEIRTLTVSGKRMSIAVYQQMPRRDHLWIESDGGDPARGWRLAVAPGEVWGWVNRHASWCPATEGHRHLVVVHEGTLYRSQVSARPWERSDIALGREWPFTESVRRDAWGNRLGATWYLPTAGVGGHYPRIDPDVIEALQQDWVDEYGLFTRTPQLYIAT